MRPAREWLHRGAAASDAFDALSNYWRGFNSLYAGKGQERELISAFVRARADEQFAQRLLDAHTGESAVLLSQPVIDMRGNGKDTSQHVAEFTAATTASDRLVALFMWVAAS